MADKTISDLTAATTLAAGDLIEIENAGGNSRKITASDAAKAFQTLGLRAAMVKKSADHTTQDYSAGKNMTFESEIYDTDSIHNFASTVTMTIASPGVVTWTAHGFSAGATIVLTTTGALPTGLTAATVYYIVSPAANTFQLSATPGGSAINTTGTQSGTHTATNTSVLKVPAGVTYVEVGGKVECANVTAGAEYQITILKNGTGAYDGATGNAMEMASATLSAAVSCASGPIPVVAGDTFELFFRLGTDTSIDITAARTNFWMKIVA